MNQVHPHWCSPDSCTAYSTELTDLLYHRSDPVIIPTDDASIKIYIYRTCDPKGGNEYVDLTELEGAINKHWYLHEPREKVAAELSMRLDMANRVQSAIATLAA